jgi:hypothetical protein
MARVSSSKNQRIIHPSPLGIAARPRQSLTGSASDQFGSTSIQSSHAPIMRLEKGAIIRTLHDEPAFSEIFVPTS